MTQTDKIKSIISQYNIPYKENAKNLILLCPKCLLEDNKYKIKLYIDKASLIFHCFRCESKGNPKQLYEFLKLYDKIPQYQGIINEIKKLKPDLSLFKPLIKNNRFIEPNREVLEYLKNYRIPINFRRNPTKKQDKYLAQRQITNYSDILFADFNQYLTLNIKLDHAILFRSYFGSVYQIRFPFSKFSYTLTLSNQDYFMDVYHEFDGNICQFPDFYTLDLNNNTRENKIVLIFEGEFDVLSARELLREGNYLIISSMGKSKFLAVMKFLELLKKFESYSFRNILLIYDNDVPHIKNKRKFFKMKKTLEIDNKIGLFIMNTNTFIENILRIHNFDRNIKDLNEFLAQIKS